MPAGALGRKTRSLGPVWLRALARGCFFSRPISLLAFRYLGPRDDHSAFGMSASTVPSLTYTLALFMPFRFLTTPNLFVASKALRPSDFTPPIISTF